MKLVWFKCFFYFYIKFIFMRLELIIEKSFDYLIFKKGKINYFKIELRNEYCIDIIKEKLFILNGYYIMCLVFIF